MNNSREVAKTPGLLRELMGLVSKCEALYGQERVYGRVRALVMAELFAFGRHTITQLLLTLGLVSEEWSSWYRLFSEGRYEEEQTSRVMVKEMLGEVAETEAFVVGVDGFHVSRSSGKMPGTGWMRGVKTAKFQAGIERGQRFVEISWLTPLVNGFSRALPIRCLSAFTQKSVPCEGEAPRTEVEAGLACLHWLRKVMDGAGRSGQLLLALMDGRYETLDLWPGLPERTIPVVCTPRNRALYTLPPDDAHGNRRYGEKAPAPHQWLKERKGFQYVEVRVRGALRTMRCRVEGPFVREGLPHIPLMLIVIGGGKRPSGSRRKRYDPCFFLVPAVLVDGVWSLPLPLAVLLAWLWQRWELEVAHRNLKSGLGLGEKQCWHPKATVATVQWSCWIYTLMMLAGYRAWGTATGIQPPGRWRAAAKRWSFNTVWRILRTEMWQDADFRATWTRSRDNWPENESLWDNLFNSILAAART